jgi:hypothetical protein
VQLQEREVIVQKIIEESNHEAKESGKHKVMAQWRSKLEQEPTSLPPYQIDVIVREVRRRLDSAGR